MKTRRLPRAAAVAAALAISCATATTALAIDSCKVKVDKKNGVILVDASNVVGTMQWGNEAGQENNAFFNSGACVVAGKGKKCQIADPMTLASKTPPPGCTLYLDDGTLACSAWIPGCTPSPRTGAGGLLKDSNGTTVGYSADQYAQFAIRDSAGIKLRLQVLTDGTGFSPSGYAYYTSNDCSGTMLMPPDNNMIKSVTILSNTAGVHAPTTGTLQNIQSILYSLGGINDQAGCDGYYGTGVTAFVAPHGCCGGVGFSSTMGAAVSVDLSPFVPPFHLEIP